MSWNLTRRPGWLLRVVLALLVLAAGLPALAGSATAAGESVTLTAETVGDTAVRAGQFVRVSGTAPAGDITSAALVAVERGGGEVRLPLDDAVLNRPTTQDTYLRNDGGTLSGRLVLGCAFADPKVAVGCSTPVGEVVAVRLDLAVGPSATSSQPLRVDYTRPTILGYRSVAPDTIEVRFSEPVRGEDSAADFTVQDGTVPPVVTAVRTQADDCGHLPPSDGRADRDGCTRLLDLLLPLGEDATPLVTYDPAANRPLYRDDASNQLDRGSRTTGASSRAVDVVRPAVPSIGQVDGRPPAATVSGRDDTPSLRAGNLTAGHDVWVERLPANGSPMRGPEVVATGSTADLEAPPLPADGEHVLRVVARDATGNLSSQSDKQAPRADGAGNPVTYVLDTVVPVLLSASTEGDRVRVLFSEAVSGPDEAQDFAVRFQGQDRPVSAVEGSGSSRLLTVTDGAPAGSLLDYEAGAQGRYSDAAGNPVPDRLDLLIAGVSAPVVDLPAGQLFTSAGAVAVGGSLPGPRDAGTVVEVLRDSDRNGSPDGDVLASGPVGSDGRWAVQVPLTPDSRNELVARARDPRGLLSPLTPVPTVVQDATRPALALLAPDGGELLPGGRPTPVRWSTSDTNPDAVLVEVSTDGVTFAEAVRTTAASSGEQSVDVVLPDVDTAAARIRLTASDRAGNSTIDVSEPFTIDAVAPAFSARTELLSPVDGRIRVLFTEPVSGALAPGDFTVDGQPAAVETVDGSGSTPLQANGARFLVLRTNRFSPDAEPEVAYTPKPAPFGQLVDLAGQGIEVRSSTAADGIRPPTPRIDSAGGRPVSDGRAVAADATPELAVSGLQPGHTVTVERLTSVGGAQSGDARPAASNGTAVVPAPGLPGDGDFVLRAVARDVNGNLSTDPNENPSPADSSPSQITYVLDTAAPQLLEAASVERQITVLFSEGVTGTNSAADWSVAGCTVDSVGGGNGERTRTLVVSGCVAPAGRTVSYAPQVEGRRYVDRAASPVPNTTLTVGGLRVPVVEAPAAPGLTAEPALLVAGTSQPGTVVDVFRDSDPADDSDRGDVLVAGGLPLDGSSRWSTSVQLVRDAVNALYVKARSPQGSFPDSPQVPVPPITQDSIDPRVDLLRPTGGEVLVGGGSSTAEWTTSDANPARLLVEVSTNGTDFSPIAQRTPPADGADSTAFQVPDVDTSAARVRITASDQVGRTSSEVSAPFVIDALAPAFSAVTTTFQGQPREVRVTFTEPVSGRINPLSDFRVAGVPAPAFTETGSVLAPQVSGLRSLVLRTATDFGPDGTPEVTYAPTALGQLVDRAGQGIEQRLVTAIDGIRPPTPRIEQVSGRAPDGSGRVVGTAGQPSVTVGNVSEGHEVVVRAVPATGGSATDGPATRATSGRATAAGPGLPDGEHVLSVVVRDRNGNLSTDSTSPAPADAGPSTVRYLLDRIAPTIRAASAEGGRLVVRFSEPVTGPDQAGDWRLSNPSGSRRQITAVEGTGSTRVLTADAGPLDGARLAYVAGDDRYVDAVGNPVVDRDLIVGLPGQVRDVRVFACPPDRVLPAGFRDTSTSTFRFEIDCLAAYAFTKGVSTDRYQPLGTVTRAQMALFVSRVAAYAGVPLSTRDAGFTDLGGRSQETRDAVNALANLGVVEGVGGGRYAPGDPVSRGQMASFLARVQRQVGAPFTGGGNAFTDDDRSTHEANIDLIAAAGVVQGVRPQEYQPLAPITRQQMAGFLMRYVDGQIEAGELRSAYP